MVSTSETPASPFLDGALRESVPCLLVRLGMHGQIGRFLSDTGEEVTRHDRVLVRSARGAEVGQALGLTRARHENLDGRILRKLTPEDELLWGHLQVLGRQAQQACQAWLSEQDLPDILLDVEPLMDGRTLYFHFLAEVSEAVQLKLDKLAELYEQAVQSSDFAQRLQNGCGPGCGTDKAVNGCASGGCAVCKVASACRR